MAFWEHLEELRWMVFRCLAALVVCTILGLTFTNTVYRVLLYPVRDYLDPSLMDRSMAKVPAEAPAQAPVELTMESLATRVAALERDVKLLTTGKAPSKDGETSLRIRITYNSPLDPFMTKIKIAFLGGVAFAIPMILYFIWGFVAPGLKRRERHAVTRASFAAVFCFICGGAFGYSFLPIGIPLLLKFGASGVEQLWPLQTYLGFCVRMVLAFGLVFEMPVLLGVLVRIGLIRTDTLAKRRPYALILFLVLSAFLTPPDIISQCALALPMVLLYEISLLVCRRQERKRNLERDEEDDEEEGGPEPVGSTADAEAVVPSPTHAEYEGDYDDFGEDEDEDWYNYEDELAELADGETDANAPETPKPEDEEEPDKSDGDGRGSPQK